MSSCKPPLHLSVCKRTHEQLQEGLKTLLVYLDDRIFTKIDIGREMKLHRKVGGRLLTVTKVIAGMRRYRTLEEAIEHEDAKALGYESKEAALAFLSTIYGNITRDEAIVVIDLAPTERNQRRNAAKKSPD